MRKVRLSVLGAVLTTAVVVSLAPASALADIQVSGDPAPSAAFTGGVVVAHGGEAWVRFTYTCTSDVSPVNHLFIAVKQGPRVNTDSRSESKYATTFYSTNWSPDSGPNQLNCNGVQHTQTAQVFNDPGWTKTSTAPPLRSGPALVQICLFDNMDPETGDSDSFIFNYTMQRVLAIGGRS
jgi:hypothetical protein